jgi:hypothetical protein
MDEIGGKINRAMTIATASVAGFTTAGLAGTVQGAQLAYQFERVGREVASIFLPAIEKAIDVVKGIADWMSRLSRSTQDTIMWVGLLGAGVWTATKVISAAVSTWTLLSGAVATLNAGLAATPALAATAAASTAAVKGGQLAAMMGGGAMGAGGIMTAAPAAAAGAGGIMTAAPGTAAAAAGKGIMTVALTAASVAAVGVVIGSAVGFGINQLAFGAATPMGIVEKRAGNRSAEEIYAESVRQRQSAAASWNPIDKWSQNWTASNLEQLALNKKRGDHRSVTMQGGMFEGIGDTYKRITSAALRTALPPEKTDEEILAELKKANEILDQRLKVGMK